jgi:2'-5' RNA ligase
MYKDLLELKRITIRFVIISVLPEPENSNIRKMSEELFLLSGSKTALLYPPHITIRTGAVVPIDTAETFIESFKHHVDKFKNENIAKIPVKPANLKFTRYEDNGIKKNMVAYFIEKNLWMESLNRTLSEYRDFIKNPNKEFVPHISLAYDDLDNDGMKKIKDHINNQKDKYLKDFKFHLNSVSLFYQKDNKYWREFCDFRL